MITWGKFINITSNTAICSLFGCHLKYTGYISQWNMFNRPKQWSKHQVHAAIQFLNARNMSTIGTHCQLVEVYRADQTESAECNKRYVLTERRSSKLWGLQEEWLLLCFEATKVFCLQTSCRTAQCSTLDHLQAAIKCECPGLLSKGPLLLSEKAQLLSATVTW